MSRFRQERITGGLWNDVRSGTADAADDEAEASRKTEPEKATNIHDSVPDSATGQRNGCNQQRHARADDDASAEAIRRLAGGRRSRGIVLRFELPLVCREFAVVDARRDWAGRHNESQTRKNATHCGTPEMCVRDRL